MKDSSILFIILILSTATIISSNILVQTYNTIHEKISLPSRLQIFVFAIVVFAACQYIAFNYIEKSPREALRVGRAIRILFKGTKIVQYVILSLIIIITLQMIVSSSYSAFMVILITAISYSYAIIIMACFSLKFLRWMQNERNIAIILYAMSAFLMAFNLAASLVYEHLSLIPAINDYEIRDHPGNDNRIAAENPLLFYIYFWSSILSFVSTWLASAYLMKKYSRGLRTVFILAVITISLLYYISQYTSLSVPILQLILTEPTEMIIGYNILYTTSNTVAGILIGTSFWITARRLSKNKIKNYLYMCGCGYVLLFASNYAINVTNLTYPPFGISGIPYVALSSHLIFVGVYSAALIVAHDDQIRRFIKKSIQSEGIIDFIGTVESYKEIETKVLVASRKRSEDIQQETGMGSTLAEDEIKEYIQEVMREIAKRSK